MHVTWSQTTVQVLATLPGDVPATAGDHETPEGMQKALSAGLYVNPGGNIHQINKRMKLISGDGEGLIANPERSRLFEFIHQGRDHGTIHIYNSLSLRTMILNTGESDDGAMAIRGMPWEHGTPGHRLVRALGLRSPHRCNYSMVNMGLDDAFIKGLLQHIAQAQWRFPSADLVMDAECVKHQVHTSRTMVRVMPKRMRHGECVTMATHIQVMPIIHRYVEEDTLLEYQGAAIRHLLERSDRVVDELRRRPRDTSMEEVQDLDIPSWLRELLSDSPAQNPPCRTRQTSRSSRNTPAAATAMTCTWRSCYRTRGTIITSC